jgi:hypothetical protein
LNDFHGFAFAFHASSVRLSHLSATCSEEAMIDGDGYEKRHDRQIDGGYDNQKEDPRDHTLYKKK